MLFRTAGFQPAQDHEAGWKPAVRKTMMLTVRDAHARVIAAFDALPAEMVSVADAAGRVLAVSATDTI